MVPLYAPRPDGSFVIMGPLGPYHVTLDDPLYLDVLAAHADAVAEGVAFPPEPEPEMIHIPPPPLPGRAALLQQLEQLRAQIEALPQEP